MCVSAERAHVHGSGCMSVYFQPQCLCTDIHVIVASIEQISSTALGSITMSGGRNTYNLGEKKIGLEM